MEIIKNRDPTADTLHAYNIIRCASFPSIKVDGQARFCRKLMFNCENNINRVPADKMLYNNNNIINNFTPYLFIVYLAIVQRDPTSNLCVCMCVCLRNIYVYK